MKYLIGHLKINIMKRKAIIYTRVSTDEQNNGYSPSDQKDKLYKYCEHNNIEIVGFYHDDESGKSFDRPEWIKIVSFIKKNRGYVDNIIFLKWDRFSRNVAEAYITIRDLKKLGVEPQAIEQPLDFEIPESKIMLAVYLAAPEVDNDRRALNIFHGIRRGKKEGRWLGACLRGYINTRDANKRPIIAPEGGEMEKLVKMAFKEFASGLYGIEELRLKLYKQGLKCNRNSFWMLLRNKGYIGKVLVPAFKDESAIWVDGVHDAIIDEHTFYEVQDIILGRRKNLPNKIQTVREEFPLRGFLLCPQCGKTLTASASKGKMGKLFYYYHCGAGCKERQRAINVNDEFVTLLNKLSTSSNSVKLYSKVLKDTFKHNYQTDKTELIKLTNEIDRQKQRLKNAKDLMLDGEITSADFKEMRYEIEEKLSKLNNDLTGMNEGVENHGKKVDDCLELLSKVGDFYKNKGVLVKQRIVSSMFPEKLIFENSFYRTPVKHEVLSKLCTDNKAFGGNKKGKDCGFHNPSLGVESEGFELIPLNDTQSTH